MFQRTTQVASAQRRTVRFTMLFVAFVCISILCVDLWMSLRSREQMLKQVEVSNTNLAAAVSQQMNSMVSEIGSQLDSIAFELELPQSENQGLRHLQPILRNHVNTSKHLHGLFVYDAAGAWLISSQASTPVGANNSDREYFVQHRGDESLEIKIGKPIVSRSTGVWIIPISRRYNDPNGRFAGVVLATIDIAHLSELLAGFVIGEHGSLAIAQEDTTVLVRRPFSTEILGKQIALSALKVQMTSQRSGTFSIASPIDGIERVGSFQYARDHPLMVTVALSKEEVLQEWRRTTLIQTFWILVLCSITAFAGSQVVRLVRQRVEVEMTLSQARDELTQANARLSRLASHDSLTGLPNRRSFDETLERAFSESCRSGQPLGLIMIDVDRFKQYNDLHGHPQGDRCLQQVARAVQTAARRPLDFVARYGGEELAVVLANTDSHGTAVVAEMARAAVADLRIAHSEQLRSAVTISAGVASRGPESAIQSVADLLKYADRALYRAKASGRNKVAVHRDDDFLAAAAAQD